MSSTELAWAAGFFDGEGHTREKGNKQSTSELQVGQKYVHCLERLKKAVGGYGRIYGPYRKEKGGLYYWTVSRTSHVDIVLNQLWPYLSKFKKEQAEKAGFIHGKVRQVKIGRPYSGRRIAECHPDRPHVAFGKCSTCYHADRYKELHGK